MIICNVASVSFILFFSVEFFVFISLPNPCFNPFLIPTFLKVNSVVSHIFKNPLTFSFSVFDLIGFTTYQRNNKNKQQKVFHHFLDSKNSCTSKRICSCFFYLFFALIFTAIGKVYSTRTGFPS